jgi:hypothetical protein
MDAHFVGNHVLVYADTTAQGSAKGRSPVPWGGGSSDPMIEAGAPSAISRNTPGSGVVPGAPEVLMVSPP